MALDLRDPRGTCSPQLSSELPFGGGWTRLPDVAGAGPRGGKGKETSCSRRASVASSRAVAGADFGFCKSWRRRWGTHVQLPYSFCREMLPSTLELYPMVCQYGYAGLEKYLVLWQLSPNNLSALSSIGTSSTGGACGALPSPGDKDASVLCHVACTTRLVFHSVNICCPCTAVCLKHLKQETPSKTLLALGSGHLVACCMPRLRGASTSLRASQFSIRKTGRCNSPLRDGAGAR